jgi:colanic acid/amylovoran biosynthesis glycosyltransferase
VTASEQGRPTTASHGRVGVFRWAWLPQSETFIRRQCDDLRRFAAVPIGAVRVASTLVAPSDRVLYEEGIARKLLAPLARRTGISARFRRTVAVERLDLVHIHFGSDAIALRRALRRSRVPVVVTLHGYDATREPEQPGRAGRAYRRRLRRLFDRATTVLAVSELIASKARALGAPASKLQVHYIGIPVTEAVTTETDQDIDILFIGRLVEKKGVDDLIRALALLAAPSTTPPVSAVVVGEGPLTAELQAAAVSAGVDVTFLGKRTAEEVQALLLRAKLVVVPSKTAADGDMEGLPTVLMEAMALGVPVIATRHSGITEVVEHELNGLLSPEADPVSLAENLGRALADPELRRRLGAAGRTHIREHFNMTTQTAALEDIYAEVIAATR